MTDLTKKVKWLVEEYVHHDDSRLVNTLQEKGYDVVIFPHEYRLKAAIKGYIKYLNDLVNLPEERAFIFHGSLRTGRWLNIYADWAFEPLMNFEQLNTHNYIRHLNPVLLNTDYIYLPLWDVFKRGIETPIFVRPDSPMKEFPGMVIDKSYKLDKFLRSNALTDSDANLLTLVSSPKSILDEARFIVTKDELVSASFYKRGENITYNNIEISDEFTIIQYMKQVLASNILERHTAANGGVLVVDVAHIANTGMLWEDFKVIEIGSFSTSSLYECDFANVVDKVSKAAYDSCI